MTDPLIRITTALAAVALAGVAAIVSCQHARELIRSLGSPRITARSRWDGLIGAARRP